MIPAEGLMVNNRRGFRYPAHLTEREAMLYVGQESIEAAIVDESAGGLGIVVEVVGRLAPGLTVEIEEEGSGSKRRAAKITHIKPDELDVVRVGLEWV